MKNNYHTHTKRCHHAGGLDEQYVVSGIRGGYGELGFSDHSPWKYDSDFVAGMRMTVAELPGYVKSVKTLREKYEGQIKIRLGLECEYFERYIPWLKEIVQQYEIEYLIFGNHYYKSDEDSAYFGNRHQDLDILKCYLESTIAGMESGLYAYLAHPDLFMRGYPVFDEHCEALAEEICRAALRLNMPLEYNQEGVRYCERMKCTGYPDPEFWKIAASRGCKIIIGADAHHPQHLEDIKKYDEAVAFIEGIGGSLVYEI